MSEQEFKRLTDIVDAYFHPTITIVDASDAVAKIKLMRPDLSDRNLAASLRISPTTMSILNRIHRASPEEREAMKGGGVLAAYEITRKPKLHSLPPEGMVEVVTHGIMKVEEPTGEAYIYPTSTPVKEEEKPNDQLPPV